MTTYGPYAFANETVSQRIARALAPHVEHAYGVVGNGNVHVVDALSAEGVSYTAVRHESSSVSAADAHYRASRRLAIATTTYGAGFTNTLTAVAEAVCARSPVILLAGTGPSTGARRWDVEQEAIVKALGATTFTVSDIGVARTAIDAVRHALDQRSVAVIMIPFDLVKELAAPEAAWTIEEKPETALVPDPDAVRDVAELLSTAQRPLVLAGRGAVEAGADSALATLTRRVGASGATTVLARGFFDGHIDSLGVAGGFSAHREFAVMTDADVVVAVGSSLDDFTTRGGQLLDGAKHVVQVDTKQQATHRSVDTFVRMDAKAFAEAVTAALPGEDREAWLMDVSPSPAPLLGDALGDDGRLNPRAVTAWLDQVLPADRLVVQDGGHFMQWPVSHLRTSRPEHLLMMGLNFQSIGLGLGGAVGAATARPAMTTVVCVGDGGGLMGLPDLETLIRTADHAVVLVFNDAAYGAEVHQYRQQGLDPTPMLIDEIDFGAVARSLGAQGYTVRTPSELSALVGVLRERPNGVVVVDLHISRQVVAPFVGSLSGH